MMKLKIISSFLAANLKFLSFVASLSLAFSVPAFAEDMSPGSMGAIQQQSITVTGLVKDDTGDPLPGVNVLEKGTQNGVTTNIEGRFSLTVAPNATLIFSYMGFATQEIPVGNQRTINVTMEDDSKVLQEVIVMGFGTQKKESVVSAVVQATNEEITKSGNVTDVRQALVGRLPGVITTMSTGEPGGYGDGNSATSIFIRGRNSWNNSAPLILVDGVERAMDNVDMTEIETITVLKDASATAVFGVKGANGVIIITTRRGRDGRPEFNVSYDATSLFISKLPDKLDSYDALRLRNESIERDVSLNGNLWSSYTPMEIIRRYRERDYPEYEWVYPNVDWKKALFADMGWSQRASLSIRGGTNFVKYFGSLAYLNENDMFRQYDNPFKTYEPSYAFNRFNFRSNFDFSLTKTTDFKVNLSGYFSQKNTSRSYYQIDGGTNRMVYAAAYYMPPDFFIPQFPDGTFGVSTQSLEQYANPVAQAYNLGVAQRRTTQLNADFLLTQKLDFITRGLELKAQINYDNTIATTCQIEDVTNHTRPEASSNTPSTLVNQGLYKGHDQDPSEYMWLANINPSADYDWIVRPWNRTSEVVDGRIVRNLQYDIQLNYSRKFNAHNVGAMGVFRRSERATGSVFPTYKEDWIFRATYDYETKYIIDANGAYNGTEKWSSDYRFAFFPSIGAAWYVSNEKFYNIEWLNRLKLRYSIGWVGDDSGGARWLYQAQYAYGGQARLQMSGENNASLSPYRFYRESVVPNPDAHWEKARKDNYAIEMGLFRDALSINIDYFNEERFDMMIAGGSRAVPPYFGATPPAANLGKVNARGYEFQVNYSGKVGKEFDYWVQASMTHTRNKVIFRDDPQLLFAYQKAEGYVLNQTRAQIRRNIYQNWDEVYASVPQTTNDQNKIPGFYNIIDFNGDGVITGDDNPAYGYPETPENTYNLTFGGSYKGFSATIQFYGVNNVTRNAPLTSFDNGYNTVYGHARDYWSKDNPNASSFLPRYLTQGSFYGNYYLTDGSYLRLKTAEVAYNFQKRVLSLLGVSSLRLYVNGNNLLLWTKLPDDREDAWYGGSVTNGAYPMLKRVNFGLKVTF